MPVSSDIYSMVGRGVTPVEDPQNALLKALKLQGAQQELQSGSMKMDEYRRGVEDDRAYRQATMESGGDQNKLMQLLYGRGLGKQGDLVRKSMLDAEKTRTDIDKDRATTGKTLTDTQAAQIAQHRDLLADVNDPQTAMQWAQIGRQTGVLDDAKYQLAVQNIQRAAASPEAFNAWKTQAALGATKFIEMNKPTYQTRNTGGSTDTIALPGLIGAPSMVNSVQNTQSPDNAASMASAAAAREQQAREAAAGRGVQLQIANMADRRARERLEFDKTKTPEDKPLNDVQSKALLFGSRMREADKVLDELAKGGTTTSVPGSRAGYGVGSVVTALSSAPKQQIDQAKRDFVNAVLRRESGAVIADSEFENADKQYFPQIGDSREVIAQKQRNRKLAIDGILMEVPEAKRGSLKPQATMPTADDVRKQADAILKGG